MRDKEKIGSLEAIRAFGFLWIYIASDRGISISLLRKQSGRCDK